MQQIKYHLISRLFHLTMALMIIFLLGLGFYMEEFLDKDALNRLAIYNLHKSFGAMVLILVFARMINRFINKPPALPESMVKWERSLAHLVHITLYLLMIAVPLSGYLMSNSFGYPVKLFSLELPFLVEKNVEIGKIFAKAHGFLAYGIGFLITFHVLGALKHRFFDRPENNVINRMF